MSLRETHTHTHTHESHRKRTICKDGAHTGHYSQTLERATSDRTHRGNLRPRTSA